MLERTEPNEIRDYPNRCCGVSFTAIRRLTRPHLIKNAVPMRGLGR
jgi:hypothetical protein